MFYDENDKEMYTIRRHLFPCWNVVGCCAFCGLCCQCCTDAKNFCGDNNHVILQEDIYPGGRDDDDNPVGHVTLVNRIECCLCFPARTPIKYSVQIDDINNAGAEDLVTLALLPLIYRGLPVPCKCCTLSPAPPVTGVKCLDAGRNARVLHCDLGTMMNITEKGGGPIQLEMSR
jgi:hypothetical protein